MVSLRFVSMQYHVNDIIFFSELIMNETTKRESKVVSTLQLRSLSPKDVATKGFRHLHVSIDFLREEGQAQN